MNSIDPAIAAGFAAVVAAVATIVTGFFARRSARDANKVSADAGKVTEFKENIAAMKTVQDGMVKLQELQDMQIANQGKRIGALEEELTTVKRAYVDEQRAHGEARGLFQVATRHIRELHAWFAAWLEGDRDDQPEPPEIPAELQKWV